MFNAFKRFFLIVSILILFSTILSAEFMLQKGNLFREDRLIEIELNTVNQLQVIFKLTSIDWKFPKDIIDIVNENLKIIQNDKKIKITDTKSFDNYLLISFSRSNLNIFEDFEFHNSESTLTFNIDEKDWPGYEEYHQYYNEALDFAIATDYVSAFSSLTNFLVNNEALDHFSFTSKAKDKAGECIENYFQNKQVLLKTNKLKNSKELTQSAITEIDSIITKLQEANQLFAAYYDFYPENELKQNNEQIIVDYQSYLANLKVRYFDEVQAIFIDQDYNSNKFKMMLDTLVRSLCYKDSFCLMSEYDVVTLDYLNSRSDLKNKLENLEWVNFFERLIKAVSLNLENDGYFLNSECMESLKNKEINAPQPYYSILQTLQYALQENWTDYNLTINEAIEKCADIELLHMLERMRIAYMSQVVLNINENVISEINSGIRYLNLNNFEEAKAAFQKAKNWQSNFAVPDLMLGKLSMKMGEFAKAEIYFDNAIMKHQQYLEPIYAKLELLLKNEKFEDALKILNAGLANNSWNKYFLLGKLNLLQQNYKKAKEYLEMAANINANNFDLMILIGDSYKKLSNKNQAEIYYKKAGFLNPENELFMDRMQALKSE